MKNASIALKAMLQAAAEVYRVDLLTITLPNAQVLNICMGPWDLLYNGTQYLASGLGVWERGPVKAAAGFQLTSNSMRLTLVADTNILIPGTTSSIMSVIASGFFDSAPVQVTTVFMPGTQWGNVIGAMTLFSGMVTAANKIERSKVEFEIRDWNFLLNLKVPIRIIQPSCHHTLYDHGCTLSSAAYAISNTVGSGSTQTTIVPASNWPTTDPNSQNPQNSPYFVQGKIKFTSGQNLNLFGYVIAQQSGAQGQLALVQAMPFPVATGDTFQAFAGCDKQISTCKLKFNNANHFGGMPFVPPPESSI